MGSTTGKLATLTIEDYCKLQRDAIRAEFHFQMAPCLITTTQERLLRHAERYGWEISSLKGTKYNSALVIRKQTSESKPELLVRWNYRKYRRAFRLFLIHHYGFCNPILPRTLQVDHLHPTSGFTDSDHNYFVRLILLDRKINAFYGAGFERVFYENERERRKRGGIHMDWIAFLKATGICIPRKNVGERLWSIWAWQFAEEYNAKYSTEDKVSIYHAITILLNLAYRNLYQPISPQPSFLDAARSCPSFACFFPILHSPTQRDDGDDTK